MAKTLIVAEKPSVARDIAKVLGVKTRGNGCILGDEYIVTWAIGHLVTLANPEEIDENLKEWTFDTLPIIPEEMKLKITPVGGAAKQFGIIKYWMNSDDISDIICATDAGREGELIFRRIYNFAECKKPFRRLWISSMTDESIRAGFEHLAAGSEYDSLYESARCRADADWLIGMNGSRAFSLSYERLLSVGRVQSPTLAIMVARELERRAFISETYYELWASFNGYKGRWFDESKQEEPFRIAEKDKEKFEKLSEELKGKKGIVERLDSVQQDNKPPLLYDLTSLQRDANYYYGFSAARTLRFAQSLYEKHKLITYPRTDSRFLSGDMAGLLKSRIRKLEIEPWEKHAKLASESDRNIYGRVIRDAGVTDHHAIIPTGKMENLKKLSEEEAALFDLIARRFIAIYHDDQQLLKTEVLTRAEGQAFLSSGVKVLHNGWADIYDDLKKKSKSADEQELPDLSVGQERRVTSAKLSQKKTKPPARYTDATLLSAMENAGRLVEDEELREKMKDSGLGTPATRAAIIERLIQVRYVMRSGRNLAPTEKGISLIKVLPALLASPELTGKWEKELHDIRDGGQDPDSFMASIKDMAREIIGLSRNKVEGVEFPDEGGLTPPGEPKTPLGVCPLCGGEIFENRRAFYCSNWRAKRCKFSFWKLDKQNERPEVTPDMARELLLKGEIEAGEGKFKIIKDQPYLEFDGPEGGENADAAG